MSEEQVEQIEEKTDYPLPGSKDKPLKIDGSELEAIILIPKGVKADYPMPKEAAEGRKIEEPKENKEAEEKIRSLTSENEALKKKIEELTASLKEHLVDDVMELKEKKQLAQEGDRERYMNLDVETLKVLLSELKEVKVGSRPEPKAKHEQLSDIEAQKAEIRKRLFGYEGGE